MSVDIRLAQSLEQMLWLQLRKRPFDVFDEEREQATSKSPTTTAKTVPQAKPAAQNFDKYNHYACTKHVL